MKNSKKQQQQVEETKENKEEPSETKTETTTTTATTKKATARKRAATSRRRPSIILCNTSVSSSSSTSTSTIRRPIAQNVPEPKFTSSNTNHVVAHKQAKLSQSVSAATKSCSNLQKSSVLADVAAVSEASKPPSTTTTTTTFPNPIGAGVSLSQFYLRYAPKNSFYSTTASVRSCHRKFGPSNPMPELTWASSSALWSAMKDKEQNYLRDAAYLKRHPGI